MIGHGTAREKAMEFFRLKGFNSAIVELHDLTNCVDDIFSFVVKSQGKTKAKHLYFRLPKNLKIYLLVRLEGMYSSNRLFGEISEIDSQFPISIYCKRPERRKGFLDYIQKKEAILMRYFDS